MAILTFDYKIEAEILPKATYPFNYQIYADILIGDESIRKCLYEGHANITNWNDSLNSAMPVSDKSVGELTLPGFQKVKQEYPNAVIQSYFVVSTDPNIDMICDPDGEEKPLAWSSKKAQSPMWIETEWIEGPQLDTDQYFDEEHTMTLIDGRIKRLIQKHAHQAIPDDFDILNLHITSDNEYVVMLQKDGRIVVYGYEPPDKTVDMYFLNDQLVITKGFSGEIHFQIEKEKGSVIKKEDIEWNIEDESIARVLHHNENTFWIEGINVGKTMLWMRHGNMEKGIMITVKPPKGRLNVSRSTEKAFVGDPFELHLSAAYENGERFSIVKSYLNVIEGNASIKKKNENTYEITPLKHEKLKLSLKVQNEKDEIDSTLMIPVYQKQFVTFYIQVPEETFQVGKEYELVCQYEKEYPDMQVSDEDLKWEVIKGAEYLKLQQMIGHKIKAKPVLPGQATIKCSGFGSEHTLNIAIIYSQDEPFLSVSHEELTLKPNQIETIYASAVNTKDKVKWEIEDNGLFKIIHQDDTKLEIQGLNEGQGHIRIKCGQLEKTINVKINSDVEFKSMSNDPDIITEVDNNLRTYYPVEDNEEQWRDDKPKGHYIDGGGYSTISYVRSSGEPEKVYAIKSGIGDMQDLLVKKPEREDLLLGFNYAARLRGKWKNSIMIYPEITFQYSVYYKGDIFLTYNESPYRLRVDAYPGRTFRFKITEERELEEERTYKVKMTITGRVIKRTLEYATRWKINYQIEDKGDLKQIFTSQAGRFIGGGNPNTWVIEKDGSVYDRSNQSRFSGVIATDYYNWEDYEIEFHFMPILAGRPSQLPPGTTWDDYNPDAHTIRYYGEPGLDDDYIGFIFRAQNDNRNFFLFLWEGKEKIKGSWRGKANLDGFNINSTSDWASKFILRANDYSNWNHYVNNTGWGLKHKRIYQVQNNLFKHYKQARPLNPNNELGWELRRQHIVRVRCTGKLVQIWTRVEGKPFVKDFEFEVPYEKGSFGMCNISQAVKFTNVYVRRWAAMEGRYPDSGWHTWDGVGTKKLADSPEEYLDKHIKSKIPKDAPYTLRAVSKEIRDPTAGDMDIRLNKPVTIKTYNSPDAGQNRTEEYFKEKTVTITPDRKTESQALIIDMEDLFRNEIQNFRIRNLDTENPSWTFELVSITPETKDYRFDGRQLKLWNSNVKVVYEDQYFTHHTYAYEGWKTAATLDKFHGGPWAKYTFVINDSDFNPEYDEIRWKSGAVNGEARDGDVVEIRTKEWYKGTYPADILDYGIVTSEANVYVPIPAYPEHFVHPETGEKMYYGHEDVHFLLEKMNVGKSDVWMYWEQYPGITTRNAREKSIINAITRTPVIKTDHIDDRVVVVIDEYPRYEPWQSGKYIGYGKVNGKRPFFSGSHGKADMVDVPTDVVFIPENVRNLQGPFIEVSDPRVSVTIDPLKKTATFSSNYQDQYIWYTDWYTDWAEDPKRYYVATDEPTIINKPVSIPLTHYDPDHVTIEKVEAISNNPFVHLLVNVNQINGPNINYTITAVAKNSTPRPWNVMIHNGYYYIHDKEHYLYADKIHHIKTPNKNHEIFISPRPQQGSPIIVRDNQGNNLRKVAFFDDNWNLTLEHKETFNGNGHAMYYLSYKAIDPATLHVAVNGQPTTDYIFREKESALEFFRNMGVDDLIEVRYKLMYSYFIDYNYDIDNDVARIVLHDNYDHQLFKDMEIIYEGSTITPFYRAKEVSLNPILNHNHTGFLYLTDKTDEQPKFLLLNVSPKALSKNSRSPVLLTAKVIDNHHNPVQRVEIKLYRNGELIHTGLSNRAGEVYYYDVPPATSEAIQYVAVAQDINQAEVVHIFEDNRIRRRYIELKTDKAAVIAGMNDEATITITLRDEHWTTVSGESITIVYRDTHNVSRSQIIQTNTFGQAKFTVNGLNEKQGAVTIHALHNYNGELITNMIILKVIGG